MKILFFTPLSFSHRGGVERYVHQLCACLGQKLGKRNVFLLPVYDDNPLSDDALEYTVIHPAWWNDPWRQRLFYRWALLVGIDFIFSGYISTGWQARGLGAFLRVPYVMVTFGKEVWAGVSQGHLQALQNADLVTSISAFTTRYLVEKGVECSKVVEIPGHVDVQRFRPFQPALACKELGLEGRKVLLTVARLDATQRRKGHDAVIQALPRIAQAVPSVHYVIVGDGSDRQRLENLAMETDVTDRVIFAGPVTDAELVGHYNACDVFIMPSELEIGPDRCQGEGFGIVYIEANACGKPVIGGWGGGVPDAVEHGVTGLLVDPNSVDEIAQAAIRLFSDEEHARKLGEQGRRRTLEQFSLEHLDKEVDTLLDRLAAIAETYEPLSTWEFIQKML